MFIEGIQCLLKYTHACDRPSARKRISESFQVHTHRSTHLYLNESNSHLLCLLYGLSELGKVLLSIIHSTRILLHLLLEMLVRTEFTKECEEDVEGLNHRIILRRLVHWNIAHGADKLCVVRNMHIDFCTWKRYLLEGCLHFWVPLLHQRFNIRHVL